MSEQERAQAVVSRFSAQNKTLSTAESCTGGLIAKLVTDIPGSSAVFSGGCVSYTNEIKMRVLNVPEELILRDTEVSPSCAMAMAQGARVLFGSDIAVSTTGYAGPGGGTDRDPVGTVYIAVASACGTECVRFSAPEGSDRAEVRRLAAGQALELVLETLNRNEKSN